jgi:hypothetical protein
MPAKTEAIEWVAVQRHRPGTNARTITPSKDRINEYARSIAMYGILVPLIAEKQKDGYHLQAGYTRLAALAQLKADKALSTLAQLNGVDLDRVPVRIYKGDDKGRLMLPIIENNFHDVMNEVDVATQVKPCWMPGEDVKPGGLLRQTQVHPAAERAGPAPRGAGADQGRPHQGQHGREVRQGDPRARQVAEGPEQGHRQGGAALQERQTQEQTHHRRRAEGQADAHEGGERCGRPPAPTS